MNPIASPGLSLSSSPFERLPDELLIMVFKKLGTKGLVYSGRVCRRWHTLSISTKELRIRLLFAQFVYAIPSSLIATKKGFLLEREIADRYNYWEIPKLFNDLAELHETEIDQGLRGINILLQELEELDEVSSEYTETEHVLGAISEDFQDDWQKADLLRQKIYNYIFYLVEIKRFDLIRTFFNEFDFSRLILSDYLDITATAAELEDNFRDTDKIFDEYLAIIALRAQCEPDKIIEICRLGINQEHNTLHALSEKFIYLINYNHFPGLLTSCLDLARELNENPWHIAIDLQQEDREEFFNKIRLNFQMAHFAHLLQQGFEPPVELTEEIIDLLDLALPHIYLEFFKKLYELKAYDHLGRMLAHVDQDDHFPVSLLSQNIQIQRCNEENKPLSRVELEDLLAPLTINKRNNLLLHCLKQNVQTKEAVSILDEMMPTMPSSLLAIYAVHIAKMDKSRGTLIAQEAIARTMTMIDTEDNLQNKLVAALQIGLVLRELITKEADALAHRALDKRAEALRQGLENDPILTDWVIQYKLTLAKSDEDQENPDFHLEQFKEARGLALSLFDREHKILKLARINEKYFAHLEKHCL